MNRSLLAPALLLVAGVADAQTIFRGTPRTTLVELRIGFYRPEIDTEFKESATEDRPYEAIFGNEREVLFQLGLEKHLFQQFGALSVGMAAGYWSTEGNGLALGGATDKTTLTIVPLQAQATYRLDVVEDSFPLVPVGRLGVDYYLWEVLDGSDEPTKFSNGDDAQGATWGWHYAFGVHLLLDFLAQDMAADFDRDAGVNGSYLTFEYQKAQVDDFGSSDSFRLGDGTFFFGLALDM